MEEYLSVISNFGFPVAMTLWFMFRTERVIKENTGAIQQLNITVTELKDRKTYKH